MNPGQGEDVEDEHGEDGDHEGQDDGQGQMEPIFLILEAPRQMMLLAGWAEEQNQFSKKQYSVKRGKT